MMPLCNSTKTTMPPIPHCFSKTCSSTCVSALTSWFRIATLNSNPISDRICDGRTFSPQIKASLLRGQIAKTVFRTRNTKCHSPLPSTGFPSPTQDMRLLTSRNMGISGRISFSAMYPYSGQAFHSHGRTLSLTLPRRLLVFVISMNIALIK
jgi:hypothetical protein